MGPFSFADDKLSLLVHNKNCDSDSGIHVVNKLLCGRDYWMFAARGGRGAERGSEKARFELKALNTQE